MHMEFADLRLPPCAVKVFRYRVVTCIVDQWHTANKV